MKLKEKGVDIYYHICIAGNKQKAEEQIKAGDLLDTESVFINSHENGFLQFNLQLVNSLEETIKEIKPDIIFTHSEEDYHQDHKVVAQATRAATRFYKCSYLEFPWHGTEANQVIVNIKKQLPEKIKLLDCFVSQKNRHYIKETKKRDYETFYIKKLYW